MRFKVSELKRFINFNKKTKRNVVYKIGYDKCSLKRFFQSIRNYIKNEDTKRKYKEFYTAFLNLFKK